MSEMAVVGSCRLALAAVDTDMHLDSWDMLGNLAVAWGIGGPDADAYPKHPLVADDQTPSSHVEDSRGVDADSACFALVCVQGMAHVRSGSKAGIDGDAAAEYAWDLEDSHQDNCMVVGIEADLARVCSLGMP